MRRLLNANILTKGSDSEAEQNQIQMNMNLKNPQRFKIQNEDSNKNPNSGGMHAIREQCRRCGIQLGGTEM